MTTSLTDMTVCQAVDALNRKECSSSELTRAYFDEIERMEPSLQAFITLEAEQALKAAQGADQLRSQWKSGEEPLPPLLGLPIAVKDTLSVANMRCTVGSRILENFIPPYNATSVSLLQKAGVVILGKTNTDEFAMGSSTENSAYQVTHNPWKLDCAPGGSSGGSAAVVAARLAPAALGTDTGGSVRQPASFCGITGLKPTYGRVSRYGLIAYGSSLDVVGVLSQTAEDAAMLFNQLAGYDPQDATSANIPFAPIQLSGDASLRGLTIGVPIEYFSEGIQPEVEAAVRRAIETMHTLGAKVKGVNLPHTAYAVPVYYLIAPAEASANLARYDGMRFGVRVPGKDLADTYSRTRGSGFGPEVKRRIMLGTYALSAGYYDAYYAQAQKVRTLIQRDFIEAFESVDVIAAPVAPSTAFKLGEHNEDPLSMYLEDVFTLPTNLAGLPGLAFPVGFDSQGLPVGIQLIAPQLEEELLLRMAHAYQQVTDWHARKPGI